MRLAGEVTFTNIIVTIIVTSAVLPIAFVGAAGTIVKLLLSLLLPSLLLLQLLLLEKKLRRRGDDMGR